MREVRAELAALRGVRRSLRTAERAAALILEVAGKVQQDVHGGIAGGVTRCVRAVYGDEYGFELEFKKMRGKTVAVPTILFRGKRLGVHDTSAGGMLDVVSFALRAVFLVMTSPRRRRLLVFDEPFKCVSEGHMPAVNAMVEAMATELNIQFVIVTHSKMLAAGKVIRL